MFSLSRDVGKKILPSLFISTTYKFWCLFEQDKQTAKNKPDITKKQFCIIIASKSNSVMAKYQDNLCIFWSHEIGQEK